MKWNALLFCSFVALHFNLSTFGGIGVTAFPSPTPDRPFSLSLRNSRSSSQEPAPGKFSLQESVARILRALAMYGMGDQYESPSSPAKRHAQIQPSSSSMSKIITRQSRVEEVPKPQGQSGQQIHSGARVIMSQPLRITEGTSGSRGGKSLKNIDVQGVRVIVGQRVPDDPQDKFFTWRNARVIKGVLVPSEQDMKNALKKINRT